MPEPNQILPMLEGFLTGDPISDHDGVCCSPAMREATEEKYILKSVSVPASQDKLEALLLAGAFPDREAALAYYKDLSQATVEEAVLLQRLARLEGFTPYESWQTAEKENGEGYDVYLLGPYRLTLERYCKGNAMTHLEAVNLGLDLCSALAVCRRSGYLYVDLKPSNIYICEDQEYRIGDLGFLSLASLPYASLPEKYHSAYTAPEIADAYSALNDTLDVYAAGLILYQVYNNGILPQAGSGEMLPPEYADHEMAAIIMKACDPDPANRWQDPAQMGQALATYLQKNTVNDTPIIPPAVPVDAEPEMEAVPEIQETDEPSTDEILNEVDQALESVGVETQPSEAEDAADVPQAGEASDAEPPAEAEALSEEAATDEVSEMLAQADDLIAHETPEGVVAPEPIDVPIPPKIILPPDDEPEAEEETSAEESLEPEEAEEEPQPVLTEEPLEEECEEDGLPDEEDPPRRGKGLIAALVSLIVIAALFLGGYVFYRYYYQQAISGITLSGYEDQLTVKLDTEIDDSLLTVVCTDAYGNTKRQTVTDKTAVFTGLSPDTRYKVQVEIYGFHQLIGTTSGIHITQEQTSILNFSAVTGGENGSVILSFTVQGPETDQWKVSYYAEGEEEKSVTFTGHVTTISGLTVGKNYSFHLEPAEQLYIVGTDTLEFTASKLIYAENLAIQAFLNKALTVTWTAPEGETVESWTVRCYNDAGFDKTVTVTGTTAVFEDLDRSAAYTVEVCAAGMSQGSRVSVSANSLTIQDMAADASDPNRLVLTWNFEGTAPEGGWLVTYTVSGIPQEQTVNCAEPRLELAPLFPGAIYQFTVQAAGGNTIFGGSLTYTAPSAAEFAGYDISAQYIKFSMCRTPSKENWDDDDVKKKDLTTTFAIGESASFSIDLTHEYNTSADTILTLFLIRDSAGNIVSHHTTTNTWTNMWYRGWGKLTIPVMPEVPGSYTVEILFNGQHVTTQSFTIA